MALIFFDYTEPEKFQEAYKIVSEALTKLGAKPIEGLLDRISRAEATILTIGPSKRTDDQWKFLSQISGDISSEAKRYNELERQKGIKEADQELSDLEKRVMPENISEDDKKEIKSYFQLKRNQRHEYGDKDFIDAVSSVTSDYLLAFLKITQAHLKGIREAKGEDWQYEDELVKTLPNLFNSLPQEYKNRFIDILVTSSEKGNSAVGICILSKQMSKQLGLVRYDESGVTEPKKVAEEHRDFYLEIAKKLVEVNHPHDYEILKNFPQIITKEGVEETKRILDIALIIRDGDFPGEHNVALLYTGRKAGYYFCGDQEKLRTLVKRVEEKYKMG